MKLVVITGCLGFIGSHITELCLKKGWKVFGIDSETYAANVRLKDHFKSLYGDNFEYLNKHCFVEGNDSSSANFSLYNQMSKILKYVNITDLHKYFDIFFSIFITCI